MTRAVAVSRNCPAGCAVHGLWSRSLPDGGLSPGASFLPVLNAVIVRVWEAGTFLGAPPPPPHVFSVNICLLADPMEALARERNGNDEA